VRAGVIEFGVANLLETTERVNACAKRDWCITGVEIRCDNASHR